MNETDHEKDLRNNWGCGTDYLNQEADLGDGKKGGEEGDLGDEKGGEAAVRYV